MDHVPGSQFSGGGERRSGHRQRPYHAHHERFDGAGYPDRLAGESIPLGARIIAVADAYSAMITDRPYRAGIPVGQAIDELTKHAGGRFDPRVVDAFLQLAGAAAVSRLAA